MIAVVLNPVAGGGRAIHFKDKIKKFLESHSIRYKLYLTKYQGEAVKLAYYLVKRGIDLLIAAGGDGTVNEVGQALVNTDIALFTIPLGTGNDYYKALFGKEDWREILLEALKGNFKKVDVGLIKWRGGERYFFNGLGFGFDFQVLNAVSRFRKWKFLKGDLLYFVAVLKTFMGFEAMDFEIRLDTTAEMGKYMLVNIGCGQFLGGGFRLFPKADLNDGLLDISLIREVGIMKFLAKFPRVLKGVHIGEKEVSYFQAKEVLIKSSEFLNLQVDGEVLALNVKECVVSCLPSSIKVACRINGSKEVC